MDMRETDASQRIVETLRAMQRDPAEFRSRLIVDVDAQSKRWGECIEPWQAADFTAMDAGWLRAIGSGHEEACQRAYLERPRGHSKTTDLAAMCSWALFAATRQVAGVAAAASRDQAQLLRDAIERLRRLNPWLGEFLEVQNYRVSNRRTGSTLDILSADAATNYGLIPDFIVADELTHWESIRGSDLWDSLISAAAKRGNCMVVVISNAGLAKGKSWQWRVRESCRSSAAWLFSRLEGPAASWITEARLAEQRTMLPPSAYNRLWLNQWQTGAGDALDPADIEACVVLSGPDQRHGCQEFVAGLDLGVKNDHSALVVLGLDPTRQVLRLIHCRSWAPDPTTGQVELAAVEREIILADGKWPLAGLYFDPSQAFLMAQRLARLGVTTIEVPFVGKHLDEMARSMLSAVRNRTIELYRDERLLSDLSRLTIVAKQYGFKLEAISDEQGHADTAIALAIAIPRAMRFMLELAEPAVLPQRVIA